MRTLGTWHKLNPPSEAEPEAKEAVQGKGLAEGKDAQLDRNSVEPAGGGQGLSHFFPSSVRRYKLCYGQPEGVCG